MYLRNLGDETGKVSLAAVVEFWERTLLAHKELGERIVEGPTFASSLYASDIWLEYTFEFTNRNYAIEKAEWDAAVARYEEEIAAWNADKQKQRDDDIDAKILKAERRLANLRATKAGEPLPFPNG